MVVINDYVLEDRTKFRGNVLRDEQWFPVASSDLFFFTVISSLRFLQASLETMMIKLAEGIVSSDIAAGERVWWPQPGASTKDFFSDVVSRTVGSAANTFAKQFSAN